MLFHRPPKEIAKLEDAYVLDLNGVSLLISRHQIMKHVWPSCRKIEEENLEIPAEALNYIANQIQSNIRELEGALTRLLIQNYKVNRLQQNLLLKH